MTKKEKITLIKKLVPPVDLTGKETPEELDAIIEKRNGVVAAPTTPEPEKANIPKKAAKSSVHFTLRTRENAHRVFSEKEHGKGFNDLADEFHKTNAGIVLSREHDVGQAE